MSGGHAAGGVVPSMLHAGEMVLPTQISQGLQSFFMGGDSGFIGTMKKLLDQFVGWWSGDSSYRPQVSLDDETIQRLGGKPAAPPPGGGGGVPTETSGGAYPQVTPGGGELGSPLGPGVGPSGPVGGKDEEHTQWYTGAASAKIAEGQPGVGWEHGGFNFAGIRAPHGGFRTYGSEYAGVADTLRLLRSSVYGASGINSLAGIISKWAPPNENNTEQLIQRAMKITGFGRTQAIDLNNPEQLAKLANAMNINEMGQKVAPERLLEYTKKYLGGVSPGDVGSSNTGPAGGGGKWAGGGKGARPELLNTLKAAVEQYLPAGYTAYATSGERAGGSDRSQHKHGNAMDVQIVGPDGKPILNRGGDVSGMYGKLAHGFFMETARMYPHLLGRTAWGGEFGTALGGGGEQDLMHYDYGGRRGRYAKSNWHYMDPPKQEITVNVHGNDDPSATAKAIKHTTDRTAAMNIRNLRGHLA